MGVLEFVANSEYRKERARQLARALTAEVGVDALLNGALADDLLAALAEDLTGLARQALRDVVAHAVADGFDEITEAEAAATMRQAIERVIASVRAGLGVRLAELEAAIAAMLSGSSAEAVQASLGSAAMRDALLAPIAGLLAQAGAGIIQAVEADVRTEAVAQHVESVQQEDEQPVLFEWQTREDDRVCGEGEIIEVSCSARHGKQLTYEEWGDFGYPGDPNSPTICSIYSGAGLSRCRCGLIPAGSAASTPTPVKITDAAKAGRERALKEAA